VYRGVQEYVTFLSAFVREGIEAGEAVLVAVPNDRLAVLRDALPDGEGLVHYADATGSGGGTAWVSQRWRAFLEMVDGAACRGVVEPGHAGTDPEEPGRRLGLERVLDLATDLHPCRLVCPYDADALAERVLAQARALHGRVYEPSRTGPDPRNHNRDPSDGSRIGTGAYGADPVPELRFGRSDLARLRRFVRNEAGTAGVDPSRTADLVLAANEIATNIVIHGGSDGTARCCVVDGAFVCELAGPGTISDPMAGQVRPAPDRSSGRGLWLANQLCDLVEITGTAQGTVTRLHVRIVAT